MVFLKKDLPFIFERFYRVYNNEVKDIEGNGLGLAIVKSIVEQHAGQVHVESEYGKGSCFSMTLPFNQSIAPAATSNNHYTDKVYLRNSMELSSKPTGRKEYQDV